ncbi:ABC transporter substrate-binding protein [Ideonella margarita]|uniref:ABC transporter substrate-binding protein n=1 Tax=Ideonella margarita TaxID=2984191 RepID=A0ABU9C6U7_9BURK
MSRTQFFAQATSRALLVALTALPWCLPAAHAADAPAGASSSAAASATPLKVVRYAFPAAETGFDPAQVSDLYSSTVIAHIIEPPLGYNYTERPIRVQTVTAAALPEVSADFKTWTVRIRPGIYFADDPAFKGQKRELTAADYVYSLKRHFDPRWKSPNYSSLQDAELPGLEAVRQKALDQRKPFDYDAPVAGIQALDRYTFRVQLGKADPQFNLNLANPLLFGAVAREVVDAYGDEMMGHPVGTGPFKLTQWRRSSRMVLERNPGFREQVYESQPAADDAMGQAMAKRFNGRKLPMIDRIEFAIIEAAQPTWLSFLSNDFDLVTVPLEFAATAAPGGKLAPNLARQGMSLERVLRADHTYTYFNMEDPVVGGYTPDKIALRRAISLGYDNSAEIRVARRGLGIPATSMLVPHTTGYDAALDFGFSEYDPAKAKALLDMYGYVDKDGDGWRDMPDGKPMVLEYSTQSDTTSRQFNEQWAKYMKAINVNMKFIAGQWPDQFKKAKAGTVQIWSLGNSATSPNGANFLEEAYGPQTGSGNLARFKLPAYDALVDRIGQLPEGPERLALIKQAQTLLAAYMPIKPHVHRFRLMVSQPWFLGYRDHPFARDFGRYVDVDTTRQPAVRKD